MSTKHVIGATALIGAIIFLVTDCAMGTYVTNTGIVAGKVNTPEQTTYTTTYNDGNVQVIPHTSSAKWILVVRETDTQRPLQVHTTLERWATVSVEQTITFRYLVGRWTGVQYQAHLVEE